MKKTTKAEKMEEHARIVQELKILKKRARRMAQFILAIERHVYLTEIYSDAEHAKLLIKNPHHPQGCQDSETCSGEAEDSCFTLAHWIRELGSHRSEEQTEKIEASS